MSQTLKIALPMLADEKYTEIDVGIKRRSILSQILTTLESYADSICNK
jgi:hypothetical protein